MSRLKFTKEYAYDEEEETTAAVLGGRDVILVVEPLSSDYELDYLVSIIPRDAAEEATALEFTCEGLGDFIAELQRARSGAFHGRYPRSAERVDFFSDGTPAITGPDPELDRLLAEEREIQAYEETQAILNDPDAMAAIEEAERKADAWRMLRDEDEMNERDELEDAARAAGKPALWTAGEMVEWLKRLDPDRHVVIAPRGDRVCELLPA